MDKILQQALNKAKRYCSSKEVCEQDILSKLIQWQIPQELHSLILQKLIEDNFLNNQRFAICFAHDKLKFNNWGKIKIKYELQLKKLPSDVISIALDSIDNEFYLEIATKLIASKFKTLKSDDKQQNQKKIISFMYSKGFEYDIVMNLLKNLKL